MFEVQYARGGTGDGMISPYFYVGLHKGEMDFGVSGSVCDLSYEEMRRLREMIVVGIGSLESMWRHAQESKNPPQQENKEISK